MGILNRSKKSDDKTAPAAKLPKVKKPAKAAKKEKAVTAASTSTKKTTVPVDLLRVLVKPIVTEKAAVLAAQGQYVFRVASSTNRIQVRQAVKALYGVTATSVNIQRVRGKFVRFGRVSGQRQTWKKAIVTLPRGTSIDVHAGV